MSSTEKYFNDVAGGYQKQSGRGFWAHLRAKEKQAVLEAIDPFPGMTCLELGCGSGFYTSLLSTYSPARLVAVDFSHNMLSHMKAPGICRVRADLQNVAFRVRFDRILCAGALEFLPSLHGCLSNMTRHLTDKGIMVLLLPKKGFGGFLYKLFHRSHGVTLRLYEGNELTRILKDCHWRLEKLISPTPMTYVLKITHE